ncbi:hypothetical protein L2E82_22962 [Cichorium intybus]|uniref:Uncharacterized protein n=1 Tax=Cichorium intybus TaxID=13427 RepID=A0ACB9E082_CICIN|nr:hypothetical protein L2E82_22962 [Cichorium intybus]
MNFFTGTDKKEEEKSGEAEQTLGFWMVEDAEEEDACDAGGLSEGDDGEGGLEVSHGINGLHRSKNPSGWKVIGYEMRGEERSKVKSMCGRACRWRKAADLYHRDGGSRDGEE